MKNYVRLSSVLCAVMAFSQSLFSQCTNTQLGGQSGCARSNTYFGEILPNNGCGNFTTQTTYSPGTYFRLPVLAGGCYTVSTCGAPFDTQINAFQGIATTGPFAYDDDSGPICSGLAASLNMVPTFTDYARVDVRQYACQPGGASSINVYVRQNNNLAFTSSSAAMCAGDVRSLTATPTPVAAGSSQPGSGSEGTFSGTGVSGSTFTAPVPAGASAVYTITYTFGYCSTTQNITVYRQPTTSVAGFDQNVQCTFTSLSANSPVFGTGAWSVISGPGTVTTPTSPTSTVTGLIPGFSTTLRWTITNGSCVSTDDVVIFATADVTAPVPNLVSLPNVTAECSVNSLSAPTATDNCTGAVTGVHNATLPITAQGTTLVTWTYTDGSGNSSTQTQNVIIDDITAPVPPPLAAATGECSVTVTAPVASDNCVTSVTGTTLDPLTYSTQGTFTVNWTFDDGNGNSSSAAQTVIVDDVTSPTVDCQNITVYLDGAGTVNFTPADMIMASSDNCGIASSISSMSTFTCGDLGPNIVTVQVIDVGGNTANCLSTVTVVDTVSPVLNCPGNQLETTGVNCTFNLPDYTGLALSSDNCSSPTIIQSPLPGTTISTNTTVMLTSSDASGNSSTCSFNVLLDDVIAPVVPTLATVTGECSATVTAPTTTDNCAGTVTGTTADPLTYTAQGTYTVNWTFNDGNGNTSTAAQTVIVDDVTAPVVPTLATVTGECSASVTAPTTTDNCAGTVTGTTSDPLTYSAQGTYTVNWTFNDGNGNTSTAAQTVIVDDVTAPGVPTLATVTGECSASVTTPTTTDNCAGTVTGTTADPLTYSTQGTYTVNWTFNDGNGNTSTATQTVIVDDVTAPVAPTLATVTGECAATVTAPTTTDNCAGIVTGTTSDPMTYSAQGTYTVNWIFNDGNGNTSSATQTVIVDDVTAPDVPIILSLSDECAITAIPPTTTDNCVGSVTGSTLDPLTYTSQGVYSINWTFDDGNGNTSMATQIVIISDGTAPMPDVSVLSDVNAECEVTSLNPPTATDNCAGTITATGDALLPITAQGTTVVIWTYDDGNGNISTQTQNVVVNDVSAPVPDIATLADATGCFEVTPTVPTATDNCVGTVTATPDVSFPITTPGTTVVTWTYDDGNGNISSQVQNVVVNTVDASVTQSGGTLTANATGVGYNYQWLNCDNNYSEIVGAVNQSFSPTTITGNYAVEVSNGVCTDTSACIFLDITGLEEIAHSLNYQLYPNPSTGEFTLKVDNLNGQQASIEIVDVTGRLVYNDKLESVSGSFIQHVNIRAEENGTYYLRIYLNGQAVKTLTLVKEDQ